MDWRSFLQSLATQKRVHLEGPFAKDPPPQPAIFVDSGVSARKNHEDGPAVGDGDSSDQALDHLLPQDKDYSDLAFVLQSLPPSITEVHLFGFLGGRRDHELCNLGEVHRFLQHRPGICFLDDSIVCLSHSTHSFQRQGIFSVVSLENSACSINGECKYPFTGDLAAVSSHGLSNEAFGQVTIKAQAPLMILFEDLP